MNIHKIKDAHQTANPATNFFSRKMLKFYNQTLKSFSVSKRKTKNGEIFYKLTAPVKDDNGAILWDSIFYFVEEQPAQFFRTPPVKTANGWEESNPNYPTQTEQNATNI